MQNLILFGFKAAGKTTLGKQWAMQLNQCFIDTDEWIENEYEKEHKKRLSCKEISLLHGESAFRERERSIIVSLQGQEQSVIALGGGAILCEKNRSILATLGELIFLDVPKEVLKKRLQQLPKPSFFGSEPFESAFERVYQERMIQYRQILARRLYFSHNEVWEVCDG